MMGDGKSESRRIALRLSKPDAALIARAANLSGRSRAAFVRDAAVRAAEEAVIEERLLRISPEGFAAFLGVLGEPVGAVAEIVEVARRAAPWEVGWESERKFCR